MTARVQVPPAPGPLENYAACFDDLFSHLGQRRGFREYLTGLLLPRERNKTLTCLAGAEPMTGINDPAVQRLQYFLSESVWDPEAVNDRRLALLRSDPATAPHPGGVLVIDDSGDRKDGHATDHVSRQWLGRLGKTDSGIVTVTTLWADERLYVPLHAQPYTAACRLPRGTNDPAFATKPRIAARLVAKALEAGIAFTAVVADCAYGDNDDYRAELRELGLAYVLALKRRKGLWAPAWAAHTPIDAARALTWRGPDHPCDWTRVPRRFRDGHTETWWAADARLGPWGPDEPYRLVIATTDPATLPDQSTWYLTTNLPRPASPAAAGCPHPPADLATVIRIYALRSWIEQGYKQVKDELGWADFQVRSSLAIRRHQALVMAAFCFCWHTWLAGSGPPDGSGDPGGEPSPPPGEGRRLGGQSAQGGGKISSRHGPASFLASRAAPRPRLAHPLDTAPALLARLVQRAPAA
ncbi:IS701 family transposase [Streptosporangium sp. NPDC051023]|uniref:IS701 family transposase n=1 Tax=Streptosporangium sp. NPDC051023 TaxID=3155410 RepID=UPI00344BD5BA